MIISTHTHTHTSILSINNLSHKLTKYVQKQCTLKRIFIHCVRVRHIMTEHFLSIYEHKEHKKKKLWYMDT